jgi:hypothetical protein
VDRVVAADRPAGSATYRRLRAPACVFVIVYGLARLAELADWSRLHRDVVRMLGLGSGTVTGLLATGKGAELLLTIVAVLALVRRGEVLLLTAIAGWTADLALLATVTAISGDRGRLLEHGLAFVGFACLLAVTYAYGQVRAGDVVRSVLRRPRTSAPLPPEPAEEKAEEKVVEKAVDRAGPVEHPADETVRDATPGETRQDLPVRGSERTRLDLPVRRPGVTRQDLPVRPPAPEPPRDR